MEIARRRWVCRARSARWVLHTCWHSSPCTAFPSLNGARKQKTVKTDTLFFSRSHEYQTYKYDDSPSIPSEPSLGKMGQKSNMATCFGAPSSTSHQMSQTQAKVWRHRILTIIASSLWPNPKISNFLHMELLNWQNKDLISPLLLTSGWQLWSP